PLCCNDIHEVSPRASALAGCDRLVSELDTLVTISDEGVMVILRLRTKSRAAVGKHVLLQFKRFSSMRLIKILQQYYQLLDGSEDVVVYCDASNQGLENGGYGTIWGIVKEVKHEVLLSIILDCDGRITSRFGRDCRKALGARLDMIMA
ncbi:hypothetical protein Tco_0048754, partial [Tanacetum coccineum]